jgi:hypothetical protein
MRAQVLSAQDRRGKWNSPRLLLQKPVSRGRTVTVATAIGGWAFD